MDLYIARHGEADRAGTDDLRELTEYGVRQTRAVYADCASRIQQPINEVVASPLVRARQTADIAMEILPVANPELEISEVLRPESTPEAIASFLESRSRSPVMLVGHQPVLGEFLSWLTDQEHFRHGIPTSSLLSLNLITPARGCGTVLWQSW